MKILNLYAGIGGIRGHGDTRVITKWGFNLEHSHLPNRTMHKLLNNLVHPELGLHIFNCAFNKVKVGLGEFL